MKLFLLLFGFSSFSSAVLQAQNVGIGIINPAENLHVDSTIKVGRNTTLVTGRKNLVKFGDDNFVTIGEEITDDKLYIRCGDLIFFRSPNSVGSGFIGVQTEAPTANMDINGTFRLRGNGAAAGKILTSDASGNAGWTGPIAFSAYRSGSTLTVSSLSFSDAVFTNTEYETSTGSLSSGSNTFTAPVSGIYHFSGSAEVTTQNAGSSFRFIFNKSDGASKAFYYNIGSTSATSLAFGFDTQMTAGMTLKTVFFNFSSASVTISTGSENTFFTGHLIH